MKTIRCAIYTRKSSDEGLEQDFNSLDAQREACAAYVLSQASEGWQLLPTRYDDGGLSGGTLKRPALQRLLADVAQGAIDIIVVYKVDRLTRSLLDFSKLVEALDRADTSFVSVTQSFNTTTSMGRLTLNMLLSFAQFEREVTAERIRDKITASKAKGMWMGGTVPLGYRADGRSLAIVEDHAVLVRQIYQRYLEAGSVRRLADWLQDNAIVAPHRERLNGTRFGGRPFSRGQLYYLLRNPIYAGDIPHRDKIHPGNHDAIIDRATWDAVQRQLHAHATQPAAGRRAAARKSGARESASHPLAGLIRDAQGQLLVATHASRRESDGTGGRRRYRYYVSRAAQHGLRGPGEPVLRLPAREIEHVVCEEVATLFDDPLLLAGQIGLTLAPSRLQAFSSSCADMASDLRRGRLAQAAGMITAVEITDDGLAITLDPAVIRTLLGLPAADPAALPPPLMLTARVHLTRSGRAMRLVEEDGNHATPDQNAALIRLIARARKWWLIIRAGEVDISALSASEGVNPSYMTRVLRLAFLSPAVIEAIVAGQLRTGVDVAALTAPGAICERWDEQRGRLVRAAGK